MSRNTKGTLEEKGKCKSTDIYQTGKYKERSNSISNMVNQGIKVADKLNKM